MLEGEVGALKQHVAVLLDKSRNDDALIGALRAALASGGGGGEGGGGGGVTRALGALIDVEEGERSVR